MTASKNFFYKLSFILESIANGVIVNVGIATSNLNFLYNNYFNSIRHVHSLH